MHITGSQIGGPAKFNELLKTTNQSTPQNILNWLPQPIQGKNLTWPSHINVREKTHQIMLHSLANIDVYAYYVKVYANSFFLYLKRKTAHIQFLLTHVHYKSYHGPTYSAQSSR